MRLNEKANQLLGHRRLWEAIEHNSKATFDEQKFTLYMYRHAKAIRKGIIHNEKRPTEFKLKPRDLLQTPDQIDCA